MTESAYNRLIPLEPDGLEAGRFAPASPPSILLDRLLDLPRTHAVALIGVTFAFTFGLDIVTPVEMSFSLLYLVPIALATWSVDRRAGIVVAAMAAVCVYAWERYGAFPYSSQFFLHWAFGVHFGFYFAVAWTLAALRGTYLRTKQLSLRDAETGLYNRRGFYEAISVETRRAMRFSRSLSLVAFEIDGVGKEFDVEALRRLALALSSSRKYDVAARVERGKFVLLLPETGAEAARTSVDRIRKAAGLDESPLARVGIATFEWPPTCVDDLLREADRVMAKARALPAPCLRHAVLRGAGATPAPSMRLSQS